MGECKRRKAIKPLNTKARDTADKIQATCRNSAERKSWMNAYIAAGGAWECADPKGKKKDEICIPCGDKEKHWIKISLHGLFLVQESLDTTEKRPYDGEYFDGKLSDSQNVDGKLDGAGSKEYNEIPEGICKFSFPKFYEVIKEYIKEQLT